MDFFITNSFQKKLSTLCKRPQDGYTSCAKDICKQFPPSATFSTIWNRPTSLRLEGDIRIIKEEAGNSHQKLGSNKGFRIIYLLDRKDQSVNFLYVYPKRGKQQELSISDPKVAELAEAYLTEKQNDSLKQVDIKKELAIIPRQLPPATVPPPSEIDSTAQTTISTPVQEADSPSPPSE